MHHQETKRNYASLSPRKRQLRASTECNATAIHAEYEIHRTTGYSNNNNNNDNNNNNRHDEALTRIAPLGCCSHTASTIACCGLASFTCLTFTSMADMEECYTLLLLLVIPMGTGGKRLDGRDR
jgi:hypothetical protein